MFRSRRHSVTPRARLVPQCASRVTQISRRLVTDYGGPPPPPPPPPPPYHIRPPAPSSRGAGGDAAIQRKKPDVCKRCSGLPRGFAPRKDECGAGFRLILARMPCRPWKPRGPLVIRKPLAAIRDRTRCTRKWNLSGAPSPRWSSAPEPCGNAPRWWATATMQAASRRRCRRSSYIPR